MYKKVGFFSHEKVQSSIEKHIPVKRKYKKKQKWADRQCLEAVRKKHRAWNKYLHTQSQRDYYEYCKVRNKCTKKTRSAKMKYEKNIVMNMKDNPKDFWAYVRQKPNAKSGVSDLRDSQGVLIQNNEEKANLLNDFFASVFIAEPPGQLPIFDLRYHGQPVSKLVVSTDEVFKRLKSLNVSKSMGQDNCHPRLLKETAESIKEPLQTIFNKTFKEGVLPEVWKDAHVTALYKNKGEKTDTNNYRPVSLTSVPCRLCERTVRDVIMKHMSENKLFSDSQYGFRNKRSCVLQLLEVLDSWSRSLDNGNQVDTIYLDIRKAFDSISHKILIQKLEAYGIGGEVLEWVRDFLKGRRQRVMLNGKKSEWKEVTSGVPQESVLGPVLFIVYINDMPDDAKIFTEIESPNDQDELQADLFDSCEWGKDWLLEHNIKKCKFIQYGNIIYDYEYKMTNRNNEVITITKDSEEKDLGIWFEENLKFNKHISVTVKKANRSREHFHL